MIVENFAPEPPPINPPAAPAPPKKKLGRRVKSFVGRLLTLGIFTTMASGIGLAIAFYAPGDNVKKPIFLKGWEWGLGFTPWGNATSPMVAITGEQRRTYSQELTLLHQEWDTLEGRVQSLETDLQIQPATTDLPTRLKVIQRQLEQSGEFRQGNAQGSKVTLNGAVVFPEDNDIISQEGSIILESLVNDLKNQGGELIRITIAHGGQDSAAENMQLAAAQGEAVYNYLQNLLEPEYRWVILASAQDNPNQDGGSWLEITVE